jgi:hypothetical protein
LKTIQAIADELALVATRRETLQGEFSKLRGGEFDHVNMTQIGKPGPGPCLVPGTLVATTAGLRSIETLGEGEMVASWDETTRLNSRSTTVRRLSGYSDIFVDIICEDGSAVSATRGHLFYDPPGKRWLPARMLFPGSILKTKDGEIRVLAVRFRHETGHTFNLEVAPDHSYYVGAAGLLVHNGADDAHVSNFTDLTTRDAKIYKVTLIGPPEVIVYIGKTIEVNAQTRWESHLKNKGKIEKGWSKATHRFEVIDRGKWTDFEVAVWEEHYIELHGGLGTENPSSTLVNDIHAIKKESIRQYGDPKYGHKPCR